MQHQLPRYRDEEYKERDEDEHIRETGKNSETDCSGS